jgi:glycine/D-amino acid oxidase-like deaminating enzyme
MISTEPGTAEDILVIGGGIIGSAVAYFLARAHQAGSVAVIEPDPSYRLAATPHGAGGVRGLFSLPENIWMSRYSLDFYASFARAMAVGGDRAEIDFRRQGYLFVAGEEGARQLEANTRLQGREGVRVELLDQVALGGRFPSLGCDGVTLAAYSPDDGWIDPTSALHGFRRKAKSLGVSYVEDRVVGLEIKKKLVKAAHLEEGASVRADLFVNAAGAWAREFAAMAGMGLPVKPFPRLGHYWLCQSEIEPLPLVKDETGLFFRPEGPGFVGGRPSWEIEPGFMFEADGGRFGSYFGGYFERVVWRLLVGRVPKFDAVRPKRTWSGHYAQNMLDGNMILGPWVGGATNFYVACGFSGHGTMHAPAVGLALSELILDGAYSTMDLGRMSYQRVLDNTPYREMGII